jgi:hypothetical protein
MESIGRPYGAAGILSLPIFYKEVVPDGTAGSATGAMPRIIFAFACIQAEKRFMKCRFSSAIAVFSFAAFAAAQPRDSSVFTHTYNNLPVIKAYHLSKEQEAGYNTTDGHLSCFWRAWDLPGANPLDSAIVKSDSSTTSWGPVKTPDDATIKLKLAWGDSGLYAMFEVLDDAWIGYVSPIDFENDCVEFFLDPHSGRQLYSPGTPYFTAVDISQLNETFLEFQFRFGGNPPAIEMVMHQWSAYLVAQGCTQPRQCEPYIRYMIDIPIDPLDFGIKIEIIPSRGDQTNIRQQEWMIPWKFYGNSSNTHLPPAENDRRAMCFGYGRIPNLWPSIDLFSVYNRCGC